MAKVLPFLRFCTKLKFYGTIISTSVVEWTLFYMALVAVSFVVASPIDLFSLSPFGDFSAFAVGSCLTVGSFRLIRLITKG